MFRSLKEHYNKLYIEDNSAHGSIPVDVVKKIPEFLKKGLVLDIGSGSGRNSIYLAKKGFIVDSLDLSDVASDILDRKSKEQCLMIKTITGDILKVGIDKDYNVFILSMVLHHIKYGKATYLIKEIQKHTKVKGLNVFRLFERGCEFDLIYGTKGFYPSKQDLLKIYKGWKLVFFNRGTSFSRKLDKNGNRHKNKVMSLVFKKPK